MSTSEISGKSSSSQICQEAGRIWGALPNKAFFGVLLAGWGLLFHFLGQCSFNFADSPSLFCWMYGAWSAPALDASHGKLIPFVVVIILWIKRRQLLDSIEGAWWPGLLILALAMFLHLAGFVIQQPRLSMVALFLSLYSLVGLAWGWRSLKACAFPFILFAFCMPLGTFVENVTLPLRLVSTTITAWITHGILQIPVVQQGCQLFDPNGAYNYDVAPACSGIRSFIALLAITTIYSGLALRAWWKRILMVALAVPLVLVTNVLRLSAIIIAAQAFGSAAGNIVHEWFGFITYLLGVGGVLLAARLIKEPSQHDK